METQVKVEEKKNRSTAYSDLIGRSVVLLVLVRRCDVPMHCSIVGESSAAVRVHIEPGWEMDVPKELILGVEKATAALDGEIK